MPLQRFVALWTHRYHKYSHIFRAHRLAYQAWIYFIIKKKQLPQGTRLVAIVRTEHFGDIVAAEPLSRYLRSLHPHDHLVWFVKPVFRELVDVNPHLDETFAEYCVTQRRVLLQTGVFDKVYPLQFRNNDHCPRCQVFMDNPISDAAGVNVHTYFNFGHLLQVFALTGGINMPLPPETDDQPRVYLQEKHRQKVDDLALSQPFIVLHTQSNFAPKDWPINKWQQLVHWLLDKYPYQVVEIGLRSNLGLEHPRYQNLCGKLSILETAEVIRRAAYFIGLDSGPSHLANATGTFGFILMGSLNEFPVYNPYSGRYGREEQCVLIRELGVPCAGLSLERVQRPIEAVLGAGEPQA
ncbi:glycosyltransferase family 9 protein [Rhabdobacter roseus]|uniref:Heptosyltransferase-3 n=1 Tax=Rhabdobacter roseus TaxID=1655419 RepID=A0A840TSR9_9BACT|nr:glycosyltransferase family 9 protein [Rhabdobacter roseus]MBB5285935.1 heptosyltransferase-3 [Rhabdobacter roseus]